MRHPPLARRARVYACVTHSLAWHAERVARRRRAFVGAAAAPICIARDESRLSVHASAGTPRESYVLPFVCPRWLGRTPGKTTLTIPFTMSYGLQVYVGTLPVSQKQGPCSQSNMLVAQFQHHVLPFHTSNCPLSYETPPAGVQNYEVMFLKCYLKYDNIISFNPSSKNGVKVTHSLY